MNAPAVPETWHSFNPRTNVCTVCGKAADAIINERFDGGAGLCIPFVAVQQAEDPADTGFSDQGEWPPRWVADVWNVPEGRDTSDAEGPEEA